MTILIEVALAANNVETILDELFVLGNRKNRHQFLELAVLSSLRGLRILCEEPFVINPDQYLADLDKSYGANPSSVREVLRQDTARLRLFLEAECQLLRDLGVSERVVERVRRNLATAIQSDGQTLEGMSQLIAEVVTMLDYELTQLANNDRYDGLLQKLVGVLEALGGALVVGANAVVGAAAAPVTGGLSVFGAGVSGVLGAEVVSRGAKRALG